MSVIIGTPQLLTALMSFAPSLMMPPCSYRVPTMKPVMFCRNRIGTSMRLHSWMNWAPLWASSLKRMPLLARMPTGYPLTWPQPVTSVVPYRGLNSSNSLASSTRARTSRASKGTLMSAEAMPRSSSGS